MRSPRGMVALQLLPQRRAVGSPRTSRRCSSQHISCTSWLASRCLNSCGHWRWPVRHLRTSRCIGSSGVSGASSNGRPSLHTSRSASPSESTIKCTSWSQFLRHVRPQIFAAAASGEAFDLLALLTAPIQNFDISSHVPFLLELQHAHRCLCTRGFMDACASSLAARVGTRSPPCL